MDNKDKIDGRSLRQQNIYNESKTKLVNSAIELLQDSSIDQNKVNVSLIAKKAGTSVATAYNHFPNNMVDVYGAIFHSAIERTGIKLADYFKDELDPKLRINKYIQFQAQEVVYLGDAVRSAFFNINEIVSSGNWVPNEPFDVLLSLCENFVKENQSIDPKSLALNTIRNFNGCLFMWMRHNSESSFWSTFTDEWFLNETSLALEQALAVQKTNQ